MKKAIVTGANGFVGSAVCRELSVNGIKVIAVVQNEKSDISTIRNLDNVNIVYCDLSSIAGLSGIVPDRDIDIIYHFAWIGSAGNYRGDADIQISNVKYTCDAVKACSAIGCKRFVFASSIMEYEIAAAMATEKVPGINTLYCSAKISANFMARTVAGAVGVEYICTVISNIFGPGEKSPRLINTSLRKMINGGHCAFSAGEQLYDFIYITDAAKEFVEVGKKGRPNRIYYIGSLNPKPLRDYLIEMRDCVDPKLQIGLGELPFNGVSLTYKEFDIEAVKKDTGFVPEVPFGEGIKKTVEWLKESK